MQVIEVPLDQIEVGERRRVRFRGIEALAKGIQRVGLLSPILIDRNGKNRYRLIAGERRLRAVRSLKWKAIPAHLSEHLTDAQLRDIELEENENRDDLTEAERGRTFGSAKKLVQHAAQAKEKLSAQSAQKVSTGGRPAEAASTTAVAEALGTSRRTVERAEKQVTLGERYSFLQSWRQGDVMTFGHHLKKLKDRAEQDTLCDFIVRSYSPMPPRSDQALEVIEVMSAKKLAARKAIYELSRSPDKRQRDLAVTRSIQRPPMPDLRLAFLDDVLAALKKALKPPYDTEPEAADLKALKREAARVQDVILERYEQLKKEEADHVEADLR